MTTYLWYSPGQERRAGETAPPPQSRSGHFNRSGGRERDLGFAIYLNTEGDPVKVTCVTSTPDHNTQIYDIKLVGKSNGTCLVLGSGGFSPQGRAFCESRGIPLDVDCLLHYMKNPSSVALGRKLTVKAPLSFKTAGGT